MLTKGFRGIALIIFDDQTELIFRFLSADFSLNQGLNVYLPSYGGSELRRIISPMTGDITGRVSTILCENMAQDFYDLAYDLPEFTIELYFYDGKYRKFENAKVENLTFDCKAGEMVSLSMDMVCLEESDESGSGNYNKASVKSFRTSTQKLVDWSKTNMTGVFTGDISSFSYSIKNNLVTVKTGASLLPRAINQGIQEVSGNIVLADVKESPRDAQENVIFEDEADFYIDDWAITHRIAAHWTYRTPLSPEIVLTTLDWLRVDGMGSLSP